MCFMAFWVLPPGFTIPVGLLTLGRLSIHNKMFGWSSSWYSATGRLPTFSAFPQVQSKYYSRTVRTCSQSRPELGLKPCNRLTIVLSIPAQSSFALTKSVPERASCTPTVPSLFVTSFKGIFSLILVDRKFHYESTLGAVSSPSGVMKGVWDVGTWSLGLVIGSGRCGGPGETEEPLFHLSENWRRSKGII